VKKTDRAAIRSFHTDDFFGIQQRLFSMPLLNYRQRKSASLIAALLLLLVAHSARSDIFEEGGRLMLQVAPGVIHFDPDPEHTDYSWLVGLEWQSPSRWLVGASYFNNSFNQKSQYFYFGKSWPLNSISENLYFKLTGGLLLGYKEPYEDKIPLNNDGIAPGAVPALGYKYGDFSFQLNLLGSSALMFTFGYDLLK